MNRIAWLINRLRVMTLREVLFRSWRMLVQRVEHYRVSTGWQPVPGHRVVPRLALFGDNTELPGQWQSLFSLDKDLLSAYRNGRINFFGHDLLDVGNPVAWQRDPVTGIEAPRTFGKSLNYRDDRVVGNVKFTWELGRHQYLVPLAVAYAVSGEQGYRQAVVDQIEGWIEDNPFGLGIHWCSALEVALRLISWAVVHSLLVLRDGEQGLFASVHDPGRLGCSIYQQARFVRYFLSRHSSANNHLIGELSGLWVACQVFDMGAIGRQWSGFAHQELEREASLQVHPDGVDKEQAFYYHLWVLEYFLFVWVVGSRSGQPFSVDFTQRLLAMTHFLEDVAPDGGEPPQIGDGDDGFVVRFTPHWPEKPYRELIAAVRGVLGKTAESGSEKAFWYQAMAGPDIPNIPGTGWTRSYPAVYPQGGYAVLGGTGCHLVFDAGPLGYLGIAAHGHADALSFCLAVEGIWWLVDPGTYAYHSDPAWRNYFRGTAAHNTVRINGQDQSRAGGAFLWLKKARARIEDYGIADEIQYVRGSHDGYRDAGIEHIREVRLAPAQCEIEVTDRLNGAEAGEAEIYFHFAPDVRITHSSADNCWIATRTDCDHRLMLYTDPLWQYESFRACTDPILGWYSPALEEKIPANTLRGRVDLSIIPRGITRIVLDGR